MRNRWGIDVKKGHFVRYAMPRGGQGEGRVASFDRSSELAKAYGTRVVLDNGTTIGIDDVSMSLGPMTIDKNGVVRQNPLTRVRVTSPSMATKQAPSKRLIKRRKATKKAPPGLYANPMPKHYGDPNAKTWVLVSVKKPRSNRFTRNATFTHPEEAKLYARALHGAHPTWSIKVTDES